MKFFTKLMWSFLLLFITIFVIDVAHSAFSRGYVHESVSLATNTLNGGSADFLAREAFDSASSQGELFYLALRSSVIGFFFGFMAFMGFVSFKEKKTSGLKQENCEQKKGEG